MKTSQDPRHLRREKIVQELFAWEARNRITNQESGIKDQGEIDEKTQKIVAKIGDIDSAIKNAAPEWEIDKINQVDLAVLRLAAYELLEEGSQPPKVIIDEAVELAKTLGNESSPAFVNGALGKILISQTCIKRMISRKLGVSEEEIVPEAHLREDLGASDLEMNDILTLLENDYAINLPKGYSPQTVENIFEIVEDE